MRDRFSSRYIESHGGKPLERNKAPEELRSVIVLFPLGLYGISTDRIRRALCRGLKKLPDTTNWGNDDIVIEIYALIRDAEWYQVYDAAEAIADELQKEDLDYVYSAFDDYESEINGTLVECSLGWRMANGRFEIRGEGPVQGIQDMALTEIAGSGLSVASSEMIEAVRDLSRRPEPELSGAVQHSLAGLEAIARHCCGDPKSTLGEILKKYPSLLTEPLRAAAEKLWGYSSERARHAREGRVLIPAEVELVVGTSVILGGFLAKQLAETRT